MDQWKVMLSHFDLDERVITNNGRANEPKHLGVEVYEFTSKDKAFKKFVDSYNKYESISFDWKGHSMGALKFYYEKDGKNILTYVLLHKNGEEYMSMTDDELELMNSFAR